MSRVSLRRWSKATWCIPVGVVVFAATTVHCGWPSYAIVSETVDTGTPVGETGGDVTPYDAPSGSCLDGAIVVGASLPCACGGGGDAGADGGDAGVGAQACTLDGALAPTCVGCPGTTECDAVTVDPGMTCIAGGLVRLGATNASVCPAGAGGCPVEMPEHVVAVSRFQLDEQEVTVKRFRDWWKTGHAPPSAGSTAFTAGDGTKVVWDASYTITAPPFADATNGSVWLPDTTPGVADTKNDALPINHVDWSTALAYCMSLGKRWPTEAEWEAAASGRNGRLFPFEAPETRNAAPTSAMLPCDKAVSKVSSCGTPTGTPPVKGQSPDGVKDLAGSLAEWVLDVQPAGGAACTSNCYPSFATVDPVLFVPGVAEHGIRGGHFQDDQPRNLRAQARDFAPLTTKRATLGFRCAK
ncbi:MAG: SUMF1/EgtB/PvdO family nonheme iron enzyme [Myxococcales bacterium]|nr:SUMF1/EgtB/PvdO family nonheme iron enzyme [Myxococcales bacterium]